jgi:hypothetical protein
MMEKYMIWISFPFSDLRDKKGLGTLSAVAITG